MKKLLSLLLAILMICSLLAACGGDKDDSGSNGSVSVSTAAVSSGAPVEAITPSTDKFRSYYQVWIGSFNDSDGDDVGDIPGLIEKLDYINDGDPNGGDDLGMDGIWLSPMMPSSTYHKYNIEDYFDIDPEFGTLDDFDSLIEECHNRGIVVIIDLVLNHSGAGHEFFQKACEELREGKTDGYARYYNFSDHQTAACKHQVSGTDYYYQGDFWDQMPDWNLSFEGTREYFDEVTKFWLDRGVDGFRLDAVKYFEDDNTDGVEFMSWFYEMAKGYKDDVYMVGELWDGTGSIYDMYESGIDSLFNFKFAGSGGDFLVGGNGLIEDFVGKLKKYDGNIKSHNPDAINANFLTNHDMARLADMLYEDENKMAAALYLLAPGNSFTYNGEEIGIESKGAADEYKRTAMVWDSDDLPTIKTEGADAEGSCPLGGVAQQLAQQDSLLNTYRNLVRIRMSNPEIARGDITETVTFDDIYCGGFIVEYGGQRVLVLHNGNETAKTVTVDMLTSPSVNGWSTAEKFEGEDAELTLEGDQLTVPAKTSVVIRENK